MEYKESILQEHFCHWLDAKHILYNASMAGVNLGIRVAVRRKRMGAKRGFPDLFIYQPAGAWHGLALELKAGKGATSPEQHDWQEALEKQGYKALIMPGNLNLPEALKWLQDEVERYLLTEINI